MDTNRDGNTTQNKMRNRNMRRRNKAFVNKAMNLWSLIRERTFAKTPVITVISFILIRERRQPFK
jgi:hypothetical protein